VVRGTTHNPDTFFQARESVNPYYERLPGIVQKVMDDLARMTGRHHQLVRYSGHPEAERVVVAIGSGCEVLDQTAAHLNAGGEKVGVVQVVLYRPWPPDAFLAALPKSVRALAVLDRTKEVGAPGEPLSRRAVNVRARYRRAWTVPKRRGRYGLSSKDLIRDGQAVFDELKSRPDGFTVGINDDVSTPASGGSDVRHRAAA
jgi:pyruvate-ferredoxin/flavodoxin oxidoreductase